MPREGVEVADDERGGPVDLGGDTGGSAVRDAVMGDLLYWGWGFEFGE